MIEPPAAGVRGARQASNARWAALVRLVAEACVELDPCLAGDGQPSLEMAAFVAGVPPARLFRLQRVIQSVKQTGAVTERDGMFAIFYLCDLALRLEESHTADRSHSVNDEQKESGPEVGKRWPTTNGMARKPKRSTSPPSQIPMGSRHRFC